MSDSNTSNGGEETNKPNLPPIESQLPEKKISTIFPYLKYSGGEDKLPGYVFKIDDESPVIATSAFKASDGSEKTMDLLCRMILPDCFLFYGFDLGSAFIQVMPSDFNENLRIDNIHHIAKENLQYFTENEKPPQIHSGETGVNMIVIDGNYEASLILYEEIWINLQDQLGSALYVCVPARDMLLFTTKDNLAGIDDMKRLVQDKYSSFNRQMSKYLYKVEGNTWTVVEKMID